MRVPSTANVVVFGGCGYVGRAFAREVLARGHDVQVCDLYPDHLPVGAAFTRVDIRDAAAVRAAILPESLVVNFAGIADLNEARLRPREVIEVNVLGNINILEACRATRVQKYAFASTAYVYSIHGSFYRIGKRTCEEYILEYSRRFDLPYLIFRYGSLYGADSNEANGVHRMVLSALAEGEVRYAGSGTDTREYVHVRDAANISADMVLGEAVNQAFILTGGERISIEQFVSMLEEILCRPLNRKFLGQSSSDHYRITQYNYAPVPAKKVHREEHIDIGSGLLDLVQRLDRERLSADGASAEEGFFPEAEREHSSLT